ncbi:MAG: nucleoside deaminase [Bacteroidales bacterium]|jgi:guanine deaminase|nr:nucleoside deaminase [Bacteroidales bacterium]
MDEHRFFTERAVALAEEGIASGGGPFGALITKDGKIIAEAWNRVVLSHDPTAHAEIRAIRMAAESLSSHDLSGCTIYASCEPCPMCLGAIYWSGIRSVFYSCTRIDAEDAGFSDNLIYRELMLDPAARQSSFVRIAVTGAEEVFRKWKADETKTKY